MSNDRIKIGTCSILGDRDYQQDLCAFEWYGQSLMAVLCDGMGGLEGGELASQIGVNTAIGMLRESPPQSIYGAAAWIKSVFVHADAQIASLTKEDGTPMNAGSTGIVVIIEGDKMQWGCVGDSRIYLKRGSSANIITRMHNYNLTLDEMLRSGKITPQERIQMGTRGEALISFLGIGGLPIVDTGEVITLLEGDVVVLCSDGIYKSLDEHQVNAIIEESGGNMDIASFRLVNEAYRLAQKKQDNTTAIAIRYGR